ncbi:hypothetical protein D9619_004536 [Psilocybe cf. subviscida]|uniref:Methyltransferase domain-containing protein n=1 Tax=Psilocybe cf. subviscida TaxID=2480587 RepID=A0A8H5F8S2_9AGAR|nr:hypothetical protein D9619_004536 [Psilocybe cf. subviscida]
MRLKISRLPGYSETLKLLKTRKDPILLDMGCCFGNDVRKAVVDGWPVDKVIACDIRKGNVNVQTIRYISAHANLESEFWDYGHELFLSTAETFPAKFIAGDIFSPSILQPRDPFITNDEIVAVLSRPIPSLSDLNNLTPLQGKVSAIHVSAMFHLFSEEEQLALARLLAALLRPERGSIIFGQHAGRAEKGFRPHNRDPLAHPMFCHSPESWKQMWIGQVFAGDDTKGHERIKVEAELLEINRSDSCDGVTDADPKFFAMNWCITRL